MGPIGIVGCGLVGSAIARRFRAQGATVVACDAARDKVDALAPVGVVGAASPAAVGAQCRQVIVAVFDSAQLEAVCEGPRGLADADPKPRTVVSVVTADPDRVAALAMRLRGRAIDLLDAPLSGSSAQIGAGVAPMFVGGPQAAVTLEKPLLDALADRWTQVGAAGMGARAKLVTNLVLGLNRAVLAEGIVFAESMGLDRAVALDLIANSRAYSKAVDSKGERFVTDDFSNPEAWLHQHAKDVKLMLELAQAHGQGLPFSRTHLALLEAGIASGEGELDNGAVIRAIRRSVPEAKP